MPVGLGLAARTVLLHTEGDGQESQAILGPANNETGHLHIARGA